MTPFALLSVSLGVTLVVAGWKHLSIREILSGERDPAKPAAPSLREQLLNAAEQGGAPLSSAPPDNANAKGSLYQIALVGRDQFHLSIREFPPFDHVDPVHVPDSYHYKGEAFDASGAVSDMRAFAAWVDQNQPQVTELFWNGAGCVNCKNGARVPCGFVAGHKDHVHVAWAGHGSTNIPQEKK